MRGARQAIIHDAPEGKLRAAVHAKILPGVYAIAVAPNHYVAFEKAHRFRLPRRKLGRPSNRVPIIYEERIVNHLRASTGNQNISELRSKELGALTKFARL